MTEWIEISNDGPSQRVVEAGGSLVLEAQGVGGSSPDNDGTSRYCQTAWVRQARREGVARANQWLNPHSTLRGARPAGVPEQHSHLALEPGQYTSFDFRQLLDDHAVLASIGSVGDAFDNAMAESFVDSFKTELVTDRVGRTRSQLELAIVEYVGWFNTTRLHEALGDRPPAEFEALYAATNQPIRSTI